MVSKTVYLLFASLLCSAALTQTGVSPSSTKGRQDVRGVQEKMQAQRPAALSTSTAAPNVAQPSDAERQFVTTLQANLAAQAFRELDGIADSVRAKKERFSGGVWRLFLFYETIATLPSDIQATDSDWKARITLLQKWVSERPQSITARVALAHAYYSYAWVARGSSYAAYVGENSWQMYGERLTQAHATLDEASKLSAKCPHWYFLMLEIARNEGWEQEPVRALFNRAIAFEPDYYHYYREFALNLLPKWNGEPGDAERFAEESYHRIGGKQAAFVYFEIASVIYCPCSGASPSEQPHAGLSWPRMQEGFAVMEELYGVTPMKLNRFAFAAYIYRDRGVANRILQRIGDDWERTIWHDRAFFDMARSWAGVS
jgi:Domain of unknown function (DUF4034)